MSIAGKFELIADEVYAKAQEDEITEFNGTAMPYPDRITNPTNITEKFEVIADEVYAKGRDDQWNENWDDYQVNGNKTYYYNAFNGSRWNDDSFKPKYDIIPTNSSNIFHSSKITDLIGILKKQNVVLDFSKSVRLAYMFQYSTIKALGVLDTTSCDVSNGPVFGENYYLETVEKIIFKEDGSQGQGGTINMWGATKLKNLCVEGVVSANITWGFCSSLTRDCLLGKVATDEQISADKNLITINGVTYYGGIFGALKDYTGTGEARTITLHSTANNRITEEERIVVSERGWTIVSG